MAGKSVVVVISGKDDSGAVFDAVKNHLDEVKHASEEAESAIGQFGERAKSALEFSGLYMGLEELREGFKELVKGTAEYGEQIEHARVATGMSAGTLSTLYYAAGITGVSFESLSKGATRLGSNLGKAADGNKELSAMFKAIGIDAKAAAGSAAGVDGAFRRVADAIHNTESPARRSQLAMQAFGKAGIELLPVLEKGSAGFDEFQDAAKKAGVYLDDAGADTLASFAAMLNKVKLEATGGAVTFMTQLIPAIQAASSVLADSNGSGNIFVDAANLVAGAIKMMVVGFASLRTGVAETEDLIVGSAKGIGEAAHSLWQWAKGDDKGADNSLHNALADVKAGFASAKAEGDKFNDMVAKMKAGPTANQEKKTRGGPNFDEGAPAKQKDTHDKMLAAEERYQQALRALAAEGYKLTELQARASLDEQLASLEASHKLMLVSDRDYYQQKREIQEAEFKAELATVQSDREALQKQMDSLGKQKPKDKAAKVEQQAKMMDLQRQMVQLDEKALEIDEKRQKAATEINLQTAEAAKKLKEQADAISANLEKQKGAGDTTARVKQSKDSYGDERNEAIMRGATQATLAQMDALQKLKEAEIELEGMAEKKEAIETQAAARENAFQQQYLAHEITKKQLADDLAASRRQELADLGQLQQAYAASAASAGAAGVKAMADVTATENEIQGQLEKQKNAMDGFLHDVLDPLTNKPKSIADAFKSMADNVLKDLERISEKKIIDNLDMAIGGAGKGGPGAGAGGAVGGAAGMAGGIGAKLGGLFGGIFGGKSNGPSNGGLAPGAGTIASDAAAKLGGGKLPGGAGGAVTVNIINQGQAVASDGATSADSGLEGKVVSIILKQAENLGPLSSLFNQGGATPAGGSSS